MLHLKISLKKIQYLIGVLDVITREQMSKFMAREPSIRRLFLETVAIETSVMSLIEFCMLT